MANHGKVSEWYGGRRGPPIEDLCNRLEPGDIIEIKRVGFNHFALYVEKDGDEHWVIHVTTTRASFLRKIKASENPHQGTGPVQKDLLPSVIMQSKARIDNRLDTEVVSLPTSAILKTAIELLKNPEEFGAYNLVTRNCEHFCTQCRYNKKMSFQVRKVAFFAGPIGWITVVAENYKKNMRRNIQDLAQRHNTLFV